MLKLKTLKIMVRTDLSLYSQYWTPSSRCAPSYWRPSVATNVTLAYSNSGTGLRCSLRCQKKIESSLISNKEKSQTPTSRAQPSVTPLLPQRQQARRLTKMQGCYSPNIHCRYRYTIKSNLTQYSPRLPDSDAECNALNSRMSTSSGNQTGPECHLRQLTNASSKLRKQNQANEKNMEHKEESGNAHKTLDKIEIPREHDSSNGEKESRILNIPPLPSPTMPDTCRTVHITLNTSSETLNKPVCYPNVTIVKDANRQHIDANRQIIDSNNQNSQEHSTCTPIHSTPTPIHSTPAPIHSTPAPIHSTPAPIHSTPTPIHSTPAPIHSTPRNTPKLPKMAVMNLSFMTMQAGITREKKHTRPVSRKPPVRMNLNLHSSEKASHLPQLPNQYVRSFVGNTMHVSSAKLHVVTPVTTQRHSARMQTTKLPQISTGIYKFSSSKQAKCHEK